MTALADSLLSRLALLMRSLLRLDASARRGLVFLADIAIIFAAVAVAFSLRFDQWHSFNRPFLTTVLIAIAIWILLALLFSTYRNVLRFSGGRATLELLVAVAMHAIVVTLLLFLLQIPGVPRSVGVIHAMVMALAMAASRFLARWLLLELAAPAAMPVKVPEQERNILIYGAGMAGRQLLSSMTGERDIRVKGFIDDSPSLAGRRLDGLMIHPTRKLKALCVSLKIDEIVLAIPSETRARRRQIVERLDEVGVTVRTLPDLAKILRGKINVRDLLEVDVGNLLGRPEVPLDSRLLRSEVSGRVVMITGAGGSIGSELARQLLALAPRRLILLEMSEVALFSIDTELRQEAQSLKLGWVVIEPELGNCANSESINRIMDKYRPDIVFHAAAYKHVPIIESNPLAGAANNIIGTLATAQAAEKTGVSRFILVSTDKAVRPPNVMGATKRVCELILQALHLRGSNTVFAMVRFGNVLGSSGSVVPRFRKQIERGGPITITHRAITRYFMTIPEAAQLVIQAGGLAKGGEVFLLDMGEPVRIQQLAETLIKLSGLSVRDEQNPDGDIEIIETGLRPGEKLYEELLIDSAALPTEHPSIFKGQEPVVAWDELSREIDIIHSATVTGDADTLISVFRRLVPGFRENAST